MTAHRPPALSIIIVNWNTRGLLADCLEAVFADPESCDWELLVVDNASMDGSAEMLRSRFPQVKLIANSTNQGYVGGNNLALQAATGQQLLLLNSDTIVEAGALTRLTRFLAGEPKAGAVGPKLLNRDGTLQLSCGIPPSFWSECVSKLLLHKLLPFFKLGRWKHDEIREVGWVTGACLLVRREVLNRVGTFDENLFMFYEDLDLCMRIRAAGWGIFYVPESRICHLGGQSTRQDLGRMLVISQQSLYYLYAKHFGARVLALLRLLTLYEMTIRGLAWSTIYLVSRRRRPETAQRLRAYAEIICRSLRERAYWSPDQNAGNQTGP
jgi:GT2 family glycosyltransferase